MAGTDGWPIDGQTNTKTDDHVEENGWCTLKWREEILFFSHLNGFFLAFEWLVLIPTLPIFNFEI